MAVLLVTWEFTGIDKNSKQTEIKELIYKRRWKEIFDNTYLMVESEIVSALLTRWVRDLNLTDKDILLISTLTYPCDVHGFDEIRKFFQTQNLLFEETQ